VVKAGSMMTCSYVGENESARHYLILVSLEFGLAFRWLNGWFASWLYSHREMLTMDSIFVISNICLQRSEGMCCRSSEMIKTT
jgi:hypothetical protein